MKNIKGRTIAAIFWVVFNCAMAYTLNIAGQRHDVITLIAFSYATASCNLVMGYYSTKI